MRFFGYFIRLAVLIGVIVWLAVQPGTASIAWHGYLIETSAAFLAVALAGLAFVLYLAWRAWRFIVDGPRVWRLKRRLERMEKGQALLSRGLAAIAGGDAHEAGRMAKNAARALGATASTRLLQAQAAQLAGDHRKAVEIFQAMTSDPDGAVLGYRGLIMAAIREKNWDEAERQTERLARLRPKTPWLNLVRFELAARRQDWNEAGRALASASSARLLEAPKARRHQAALLLAASDDEAKKGLADQALRSAEKAVKLAPDWLPGLLVLARRNLALQNYRTANRVIERAWKLKPHSQLVELYLKAQRAGSPLNAHKQLGRLARTHPDNPVSHLALAETAVAADLWGEARRHVMALVNKDAAPQSAFRLLSRLERRETGDEKAASQWLMKAAEALPDPRWLCTACGGGHDEWQVLCAYCGAFDSLDWQTPGLGHGGEKTALLTATLEPFS